MKQRHILRKIFQFKYAMVYPAVFILVLVIVVPLDW